MWSLTDGLFQVRRTFFNKSKQSTSGAHSRGPRRLRPKRNAKLSIKARLIDTYPLSVAGCPRSDLNKPAEEKERYHQIARGCVSARPREFIHWRCRLNVVKRTSAFLMAAFSLVALTVRTFGRALLDGSAFGIGNVAFGAYCLLVGYLIYRSRFMPRGVGVAMALGGLGLITYGSPELVKQIYPYNVIPALIGETALMISLLVVAVDAERWRAKAVTRRRVGPAATTH